MPLKHKEKRSGQRGESSNGSQNNECSLPTESERNARHRVARQDSPEIANAINDAGGCGRSLLAAKVQRHGAGEIRVRTDDDEPHQCHQRHGQVVRCAGWKRTKQKKRQRGKNKSSEGNHRPSPAPQSVA